MLNVISVDVEEYFHAANLESAIGPARWHSQQSRVDYSTRKVLEIFARHNVRATFFILGYSARRFPTLVRDIAAAGHEIASHGYGHRLAYSQSPKMFFRDVRRTKLLLEDISGMTVLGYRAPNFSILTENEWAYDALIEAGYLYDSSLYPVWHPRYANLGKSTLPQVMHRTGGKLYIFPLAVWTIHAGAKEFRLPVAGGAYWRFFPVALLKHGLTRINKTPASWFTCYFHPWEVDPDQPVIHQLSLLTKLRHYGGIARFEKRLDYFLSAFSYVPLREAAEQTFGNEIQKEFAGASITRR